MNVRCPACGKTSEPDSGQGDAYCPHCGAALPGEALRETGIGIPALPAEADVPAAAGADESAVAGDAQAAGEPDEDASAPPMMAARGNTPNSVIASFQISFGVPTPLSRGPISRQTVSARVVVKKAWSASTMQDELMPQ